MQIHGLGSWLPRRRLRNPDKTALIYGEGQRMSYARFAHTAEQISAILAEHGVTDGDPVAYLGENSPEFLATLFGAARLGAVFVPVNTRLAAPEVRHVLSDSGARVLLHDPEFADRLSPVLETLELQAIETGVTGRNGAPGLGRLLATVREVPAAAETPPEHPAAIVYTSGTTGRAKGAVLTHGNLTAVALNCIVDYDVVSSDVALMISPLFHVASLGMGALPAVLTGATLVLEKGFEAGRALDLIERHAVTMMSGVPTTYQLIADHPSWATTDLSSLHKLTCGGSAVPSRIIEAFEARGLAFTQGYGMTETSPGATSLSPAMTREKSGSVGLPHFFTDVRIAAEDGSILPAGEIGEVQISGPNVFAGYHGLPEATAAAFTPDGWFRSGDLGRLDDDGYLYIADRLKDMIISGGENIYPAEVENVLAGLDGVTGVAVIGVPDERWGEVPIAVVTVRDGVRVDTDTVRAALAERIARYKIPKRVIVVGDLPRTASGKVRKHELRERYAAD
ncbi:acyl-CoA synthetase [Microbacterium sp. Root180]|uniref:acyl-CoA synthetase n=1 Tax=Microbacterium sp. Root180 TaxID=1736483 RepID=UPI0006FE3CF2|nr:long-chain fatty acid--CoA ligase [Microbacterium sp. Root180]KRB35210.1 AMP-dependent synthetase [Microbacterium sp. Root180]